MFCVLIGRTVCRPGLGYCACVWPTLTYSILEVGLHEHGAQQVHGLVMRQLRSISQSPVHITRESNDTLLHRIRRPFPLDFLTTTWVQKVQCQWQDRRTNLEEGDATLVIPRYPPLCKAMNGEPCSERRQPRDRCCLVILMPLLPNGFHNTSCPPAAPPNFARCRPAKVQCQSLQGRT